MSELANRDASKAIAIDLMRKGQVVAAAAAIERILSDSPDDVSALVISAMIESQRQANPLAETRLRRAIELEPTNVEALIVLSKLLAVSNRLPEAIVCAEEVVLLQPEDGEVWSHLGLLLVQVGRIADAAIVFGRGVEASPTNKSLRQNYAAALRDTGRDRASIEQYEALVHLDPRNASGWLNLARLLLGVGRFPEALVAADHALQLDKLNASAQWIRALALTENNRGNEAEPHLRRAIKLNPQDGLAKAALGYWLQEEGRFSESLTLIEDAIRLVPNHGFAYYNYFRAKKATEMPPEFIEEVRERALDPSLHVRDRGDMNYALGKAYEDLRDYESSIHHFTEGNRCAYEIWLQDQPWQRTDYENRFSRTIDTFTEPRLRDLATDGLDSDFPLLIVGMMRSGTSLLEQILSSHPEVVGGGELAFWHENEDHAYGDTGKPDATRIRELGHRYLAELQRIGPDARRVTDKLPHNYAMLGLIHSAFPKAKIIHVKRNPADNCLSIFTTSYQRPPVFAHDRDNIVFAYRQYERIMAHWLEVLPASQLMEIQYEDLVANRDELTRQLIDFAGLPWDDACLHHQDNARTVRTPSLWQVRQPIYNTSISRWKRYEPWIPEFANMLAA
jgi:tetratricopeptide (TPR) repeat protein